MFHSPAVQLGRSKGHFLPSQVQTAPLHQSTQSTVSLTQPPVTASTNLTPPEMTTPPEPHMIAHTGMSLVTELLTSSVVLFPVASLAPPNFPSQYGKQVMGRWTGPGSEGAANTIVALLVVSYCTFVHGFCVGCCAHRLGCKGAVVRILGGQFSPWVHEWA